jgi:hypothetical protein
MKLKSTICAAFAFALTISSAYFLSLLFDGSDIPCPALSVLQSNSVRTNFNYSRFKGTYYELAYKDLTQPLICDCMRTTKTLHLDEGYVHDKFILRCAGVSIPNDLIYQVRNVSTGSFYVHWKMGISAIERIEFQDYVVDVGADNEEQYRWVLEFQCIPQGNNQGNWFYALLFYVRDVQDIAALEEMKRAARAHGLGRFLDKGLNIVDHSNCAYS